MDFMCGAIVGALAMGLGIILSVNQDDYVEVDDAEEVE